MSYLSVKQLAAAIVVAGGLMTGTAMAATYHFKLVDKIALPTPPGHGDWVAYDPGNGDVYVSMPNNMAVIDTKTNKVIADVKPIDSPNTMAFDKDYVYETSGPGPGKPNYVMVISKKDWKIVDRVKTQGTSPDGTWIDPDSHMFATAADDNNWMEVYDIADGAHPKFVRKIPLWPEKGSGPDAGTRAPGSSTLYASDDAWEEIVDPKTGTVGAKVQLPIKVTKKGGTKGQFYDPKTDTLWVATTLGGSPKDGVFLLNPKTLAIEKVLPAKKAEIDQMSWDPDLGLAYTFQSAAKGFGVYNTNTDKFIQFVTTGGKIQHTGDVDLANHEIYILDGGHAQMLVYKPEKAG